MWKPDMDSGIWLCDARLGEISDQKGSTTATGSTGGFWIGLWSPDAKSVISLGRTGSWRLWNYDRDRKYWQQGVGVGGHTKSVMDISWSKDGSYLLSTASDQTTRLSAEWNHGQHSSWHEFGRPQIHGYDLKCIDSIGNRQFVSGAEEKLLRVFDEPRATAILLQKLSSNQDMIDGDMPGAASIPVLGLSNKAVEDAADDQMDLKGSDEQEATPSNGKSYASAIHLDCPPPEDDLARHTLWPERDKLYGHGHEISTVAASHDGTVIATACKASSLDQAVIRLFETKDWQEIKPPLTVHSLTVTCLRFSKDDRFLLSVGRDRRWAVFERENSNRTSYLFQKSVERAHSRMILSACWVPSTTERVLVTAGRDRAIKFWRLQEAGSEAIATIMASLPVTAVDVFPILLESSMVIASGTENGDVSIHVMRLHDSTIVSSFLLSNG
ncbi:MAG: hypothetical protein Q9190_001224 [Brigantiaea leucoxantha]